MADLDILNGTPTAPGATEFDEWLRDRNARTAHRASTAITAAGMDASPDEIAKRRQVSAAAGSVLGMAIAPPLLSDPGILSMVESKVLSVKSLDILTKNPALAEWFSEPDNAAIAADRVEELGFLSNTFNAFGRMVDSTGSSLFGAGLTSRVSAAELRAARDVQRSFGDLLDEEIAIEKAVEAAQPEQGPTQGRTPRAAGIAGAAGAQSTSEPLRPFAGVEAMKRWVRSRVYGINPIADHEGEAGSAEDIAAQEADAADALQAVEREATERTQMFPYGRDVQAAQDAYAAIPTDASFGESAAAMFDIVQQNPDGFLGFIAGSAIESGGGIALGVLVGAATRNPMLARAVMAGTSAKVAGDANAREIAATMGYDLSTPEGAAALAKNSSDLNRVMDASGTYGTVIAVIDAATAGLGSELVKSPMGAFVVEAVAQAASGSGGEVLARMASGQDWTWADVIVEGLAEMMLSPLEAGAVGMRAGLNRYNTAQSAADRRGFFKALSEGAKSSELRKRSPEAYKSAIDKLTANGPVENVYVDAARLEALYQDNPEELKALFDGTPGLDYREFQQAAATASVLAIPTGTYAAHIAGTAYDTKLTDHLRLRPDSMSYAEAKEAMAEAEQELQGLETRLKELESMATLDQAAQAEYESTVSQLIAAGRAPGVARAEAEVFARAAQTMAARRGVTTQEIISQNIMPIIRREGAAQAVQPFRIMTMDDLNEALRDPARATLPEFEAIAAALDEQGLTPETATLDDVRLAAIAVADSGGLVSTLDEEFLLTPSGIYKVTPGETMMQTVSLRNGEEDLSQWGHVAGQKITTRALALIMQKRQRALYGKIGRKNFGKKTIEKMANWMADEIEFELQTPGAAAEGWYTTKFQAGLDTLAQRFPELDVNREWVKSNLPGLQKVSSAYEARQLMTMILAITSNGATVENNYAMAVDAYRQYRETGRFYSVASGERSESVTSHLARIGQLIDDYDSVSEVTGFLMEELTVSELNKQLKRMGRPPNTTMPSTARVPRAAVLFGPKLGAFYANLSGAEGYLTMDLWWTRTINRYRGDVLPKVPGLKNEVKSNGEPVGLNRFKHLIGRPDLTDAKALRLVVDYAQAYKDKRYKNGTAAEMAANTLYKAAFAELQEAPLSPRERGFMIEVASAAREELARRTGKRYSIADVQALIWYYEKRLMAEMGAKESGDLSYDEAARRAIDRPGRTAVGRSDAERFDQGDAEGAGGAPAEDAGAVPAGPGVGPSRLPDLENASPGPVAGVRELASRYMARTGLPVRHQATYVKVDKARAAEIARLYDEMPDAPDDPEVKAAYRALAQETIAQYDALLDLGFTFEWITGDDPYASPADAIKDMQENGHLWVFPTDSGFGSINEASAKNPLLAMSGRVVDGREARINDLFRIVHDVFGHGSEGASFGPRGEENAWQAHVRMFSPLAARAMTSETRGQNSWVNYGPYGEANRANPKETTFADQKVGLLPGWVSEVGQADDVSSGTFFQSASTPFTAWFGDSVVANADGTPMVVKHGTRWHQPIDEFLPLTHFGTATAASQRLDPEERWSNPDMDQQGAHVYPVYLSIQNPLEIGREQGFSDSDGWENDSDMVRQIAAILNTKARETDDRRVAQAAAKLRTLYELGDQIKPEELRREAAEILQELGYDGLTYTNIIEDAGKTSYVVLRAEQVKSQFNRGTYDPDDPRILYQGAPNPVETAVPADFEGDIPLRSFRKRGWFIVSATQSHFGEWDSPENVAEAERMRKWLADTGLAYREARGRYNGNDDGPSFLVFGDETTYGMEARKMFRQESILTRQGFVYSPYDDRKPVPFIGMKKGDQLDPKEDYLTELSGGETFSLVMDWPDPKSDDPRDDLFLREDGLTELVHWSPKERATIDPRHAGKGAVDGPERHRSGPNKTFFGLNDGKRNTAYKRETPSLGGIKHTVAIDPKRLYPWDTDPDGLRAKVDGKLPAAQQVGAYESAIKRAGYAGYFVIDGPLGDVAALFESVPVEKAERDTTLYQSDDAFFKSALAEAINGAKQESARPGDWIAVLSKMPGVKKAELEWTGVLDWLGGLDPAKQVTRQHLYHWVNTQQVRVERVDGGGSFEGYTKELNGAARYEEILLTVPNLEDIGPNAGREVRSVVANSGHFDEPNIVVHARVQTTPDTLFVDEVQSDLNSFWRKHGGQAQALLPPSEEVQAEIAEYDRLRAMEADRDRDARAGRERVYDATGVSFVFNGVSVDASQVEAALFGSSATLGALPRTTSTDAFDAMLGVLLQRANRSLIPPLDIPPEEDAEYDATLGRALREAVNGDLEAMVREYARSHHRRVDARDAVSEFRRRMSPEALRRWEGGGSEVLPLPLSPFEDASAIQLAMKYLTTYAARAGFKRIAWTPGYMQMKRWGVQEQQAAGMITSWLVVGGAQRALGLSLANGMTGTINFERATGAILDTTGFPPALFHNRNIRDVLPQALVERAMADYPAGESLMQGTGEGLPEMTVGDKAGEGYRNVYDRQMKNFLAKWAGKFGATVETDTSIAAPVASPPRERVAAYTALWGERAAAAAPGDPSVRRFMNAAEDTAISSPSLLARLRQMYESGQNKELVDTIFRAMTNADVKHAAELYGDADFFAASSDPVWSLTFNDDFRAEASKPQPLFQDRPTGARGQIILPPAGSDAAPEITVFDRADLSTVMHEGGHWMLWLLQSGAAAGSEFDVAQMEIVKGWFASQAEDIANEMGLIAPQVLDYLQNGTTGAADVDAKVHRGLHERFARGFEAYLREGKAPSIALKGVFHRFAAWLMEVYRSAKGLRVELSDEVRQVFDKMLATDAELAQAKELSATAAQIAATAKAMGLDEASYAELVRLQDEERAEAFGIAMREALAPIMAQRSKELRAFRAETVKRISDEVNAKPYNRAFEWLANGRWLGVAEVPDDLPADLRFDPEQLHDDYGQPMLDALPRGRRPMTKVNGLSADEVAGWFGYVSGAELLRDLTTKPRARDEIKQRVADAMAERAAAEDPRDDAEKTSALVDALHGEKHGQVLAAELRAINRISDRKRAMTSRQQAAQIARDVIARTPVREAIRSDLYAQQARKYGEEAARLLIAGNTEEAFDAKRKQLIQHSLYVESRKAADLVARTERKAAQLKKPGTRKNLAGEYLEAIDEVLYNYDFRKTSAAADRKRGALLRYVEMMLKAGRANELAIPDYVMANANRTPYKTLSVQRLQGVLDTLVNIEHTARLKKKLTDRQRERDMDAVVADIQQAFAENIKGKDLNRVPTGMERVRDALREYVNYASNADTLLRRIDGWRTGDVSRHLKGGIDRASSEEVVMRMKAATQLDALFAPYAKFERRQMAVRQVWNGYDQSLSKWDLISIALNSGNKDNWERLTSRDNPRALTPAQAEALLENLDERDWKFVQSVWDHLNAEYWPQIAAREKRTTGVVPKKVDAMFMAANVKGVPAGITGGYYPIVYDRRFSAKVAEEKHQEIQTAMMAGRFGKAQTRNGHTKERAAGSGGRTLELGIHVLFGHVNQVIHDLALSEEVANAWKILQDPRVRGLFEQNGILADLTSLEVWLQDVAAGQIVTGGVLGRMARHAKSGFTVSKLAFNLSTVMIQPTGLVQSAAFLGKRNMVKAYSEYVAQGMYPAAQRIKERSAFMAERERTFQRDMFDLIGEATDTPVNGRIADARSFMMSLGFWAMQKVQYYVVDAPTWIAGYNQGKRQGMSEDEAVQHADRAVARGQASGIYADRTAIERGSLGRDTRQNEFLRLFTALGSYMFAKFNVAQEIAGRTGRDVRDPNKSTALALANGIVDMLLIFTVEAVLYNMIKGTLPGDDDEEEERSWLGFLAAETFFSAMGTLPFIRDMGSALRGFDGGGAYGGVLETVAKPFIQIGQGEVDMPMMRSFNDLIGLSVPGYPSTAIWRLVDAEVARQGGEDVSPINYIMGLPR